MLGKTLFSEKRSVVNAATPANATVLSQYSGHRPQHLVPRNTVQRPYSADMLDDNEFNQSFGQSSSSKFGLYIKKK
jgi:hypothetical protein